MNLSKKDLKYIRDHWETMTLRQMSKHLKRAHITINAAGKEMGLSRKRKPTRPETELIRKENEYILANYADTKASKIAAHLGIQASLVHKRVQNMRKSGVDIPYIPNAFRVKMGELRYYSNGVYQMTENGLVRLRTRGAKYKIGDIKVNSSGKEMIMTEKGWRRTKGPKEPRIPKPKPTPMPKITVNKGRLHNPHKEKKVVLMPNRDTTSGKKLVRIDAKTEIYGDICKSDEEIIHAWQEKMKNRPQHN